jgi:hypothetical protein
VISGDQIESMIEAIDIHAGSTLWGADFPFDKAPNDIIPWDISCPGSRFILDRVGTLITIDPESKNLYVLALPDDRINPSEDYYLVAIDLGTGQVQWHNNKYKSWLGDVAGTVIYTQPEFGLVQGYEARDHALVWENDQVILAGLIGSSGDTIVGITDCCPAVAGFSGFAGLNAHSGEIEWELEEGDIPLLLADDRVEILFDHLVYPLSNERKLIFINPKTGSVETELILEREPYRLTAQDGFIFVNDGDYVIEP